MIRDRRLAVEQVRGDPTGPRDGCPGLVGSTDLGEERGEKKVGLDQLPVERIDRRCRSSKSTASIVSPVTTSNGARNSRSACAAAEPSREPSSRPRSRANESSSTCTWANVSGSTGPLMADT